MGSNRRQPFGYTMEFGRIITNEEEAEQVARIFTEYNRGASFAELAEMMRQTGVAYDAGKAWNKNMIARILGDRRYLGEDGLPAVIEKGTFQEAISRRENKTCASQKTDAQKILRRKCNRRITPHIENEVLFLLNGLIRNPDQIQVEQVNHIRSERLETSQKELDNLLIQLPVDSQQATKMILETSAAMYECIDSREYEAYRMKRLLQKETLHEELDARLIGTTITAVLASSNGEVKIQLKNDQIVGRGEIHE